MAQEKPHQAISNAEKAVQSTTDRVAKTTHDAIDSLSTYSTQAEERLRETGRVAAERTREYADEVGAYVARRPLASLAMALGAGLLLGAIMKGRG